MKLLAEQPVWKEALAVAADPQRARHYLDRFAETDRAEMLADVSAEQARSLTALFSGSCACTELLFAHPAWLESVLAPEDLAHPRQEQGVRREVNAWLEPALEARDYAGALSRLRQFKQHESLRIAVRDLAGWGRLPEVVGELSTVADVCLSSVAQICERQLAERMGRPWHQDPDGHWQPTPFAVVGLGKLGGQELNYSSDVDVIFVYGEEGQVFIDPPGKTADRGRGLSNHQFFTRLAERLIAEVSRQTPEGMLYRIDLRLRPEGEVGPLVRGLSSYETYYAQWGQVWERMMLIKARGVAGDAGLAGEFIEMIQPFRYPRSIGENVMREIAGMKERLEQEIVREGEIERNVKLGRGGIREIEFVVQALQLVQGGRLPFLQTAQTLTGLEQLARYRLVTEEEAGELQAAYQFLRDVEHRLQMEHHLQRHTIPDDPAERQRLARLMGFSSPAGFQAALDAHTGRVRHAYEKFLQTERPAAAGGLPLRFDGAEAQWKQVLADHSFRDVDRSFRLLHQFVLGPGFVHVSPRTTELAWQLLPRLFSLCRRASGTPLPPGAPEGEGRRPPLPLSDPDRVMARLDSYVSAYGARATLFETWTHNPNLFELLVLLFDRSEFLAEAAIRTPDLVDELVLSDRLRRGKSSAEVLTDLRYGAQDKDQQRWIRQYHHAEFMRIGLRDILGLADLEKVHAELTALADACLQYAMEITLRKHRRRKPPFVIVGLGKLGGREIDYGSDVDVVFVAETRTPNLPRLQPLAVEIIHLLAAKTELGSAFEVDARLRPDGETGLLVNTLAAFEDYYRQRAMLWEIQTLTRTRPVAGNLKLGAQFQQLATHLTDFRKSRSPVAAYTPDWKRNIARMRERIEKERTPAGRDELAIKTGTGGLMDAEFIAQTLCLAHGWQEANTMRALEKARNEGVLDRPTADKLIGSYGQLREIEAILRRWSFEGETVLPTDPEPYYRVSIRCGSASPEDFRQHVAACRQAIREVYTQVMKD